MLALLLLRRRPARGPSAPIGARLSIGSRSALSVVLALSLVPAGLHAQTVEIEIEEDDAEIVVPSQPAEPAPVETSPTEATAAPEIAAPETAAPDDVRAETAALRAELAALRARLDALEPPEAQVVVADTEPEPSDTRPADLLGDIARGITISGYVQAQYEWSDLSEDQLLQGGVVMNRDRFSIRRGRVRIAGEWDFFALEIELDGSTTRGPFFGLRRTTVGALLRGPTADVPPLFEVSAGLTEIPFGHEVRQSQRDWLFMERSLGSLSFFRGPLDAGVRAQGGLGPFRYDLAVMGGTPLDDRAGQGFALDPTSAPDLAGRLGAELDRNPGLELAGGVSFLWGTGFHAGEDATKGRLEWRDLNESGTLDTGETIAIPGRAATPSSTFERWAFNVDAHGGVRTPLGWTRVFVEATVASNLDRAMFVADPVVSGLDVREVSAYAAVTQELFDWGLLGFRYDYYDPNSDLLDQRLGLSIPADASIHTLSPLVGARIPDTLAPGFRARLVFQYDVILDALGRDARGVPADLRNDQFTLRLQGELR